MLIQYGWTSVFESQIPCTKFYATSPTEKKFKKVQKDCKQSCGILINQNVSQILRRTAGLEVNKKDNHCQLGK